MVIELLPIGFVSAPRPHAEDDYWGGQEARITLVPALSGDALRGLEEFSHIEVIYCFHGVDPSKVVTGARHPRNNTAWPLVGILAQRAKNRPNRLGSTICRLVRVEKMSLVVAELDAIHGTPVLDLKPVMQEFLPRGELRQPAWSHELMRNYWSRKSGPPG